MNIKCLVLFVLCLLSGLVELVLTLVESKNYILSVVVCSFGILCFILFLIAVNQERKGSKNGSKI